MISRGRFFENLTGGGFSHLSAELEPNLPGFAVQLKEDGVVTGCWMKNVVFGLLWRRYITRSLFRRKIVHAALLGMLLLVSSVPAWGASGSVKFSLYSSGEAEVKQNFVLQGTATLLSDSAASCGTYTCQEDNSPPSSCWPFIMDTGQKVSDYAMKLTALNRGTF